MSTTAPANAPRFALAPDDRTAVIDTKSNTGTPRLMKVLCRALVEEDAEFVARAASAHEHLVAALQELRLGLLFLGMPQDAAPIMRADDALATAGAA